MNSAGFETFAHTADLGLRVWGPDPESLLTQGALGLFSVITDLPKMKAGPSRPVSRFFALEAPGPEELFLKWLRELLFEFSAYGHIFWEFEMGEISGTRIRVSAAGGVFDPKRDDQKCEVKAVTYHEFSFTKTPEGYDARVILDL